MSKKKYVWSLKEFDGFDSDIFSSTKECIKDFKSGDYSKDTKHIYVGEYEKLELSALNVYADEILSSMSNQAFDICGDVSDQWGEDLFEVEEEKLNDLSEKLKKIVIKFLKENNLEPNFGAVDSVKKVIV